MDANERPSEPIVPTDDAPPPEQPFFSAQLMGIGGRLGMLFFMGVAYVLTAVLLAFTVRYPHGLLDVDPTTAMLVFGTLAAIVAGLVLTSLALLENTPRVSPFEKQLWAIAFVIAGPLAIPVFFWTHVWHAPLPAPRPRRLRLART